MNAIASTPTPAESPLEEVARRAIAAYRVALAEIDRLRERVAELESESEREIAPGSAPVVHLQPVPDEPDFEMEVGLHSVDELELADAAVRRSARRRSMREIERRLGKLGTAAANR
jgi:hypothetical protein